LRKSSLFRGTLTIVTVPFFGGTLDNYGSSFFVPRLSRLFFRRIVIAVILQVRGVERVRCVHMQATLNTDQRQIVGDREAADIE
jgi:hypothetical protein